jgi:tripartite ATP-independent transporter DctM subunit
MSGILLLLLCFFQMATGVPLYVALLFTGFLGIAGTGDWTLLRVIPQQFFGGMDVFSLMAIPFFILAGILMNRTGLTDRLIDFSRLLVGSVRGGLGYVNVVGGIILAGVNGSAAADASALGSILIPAMEKEGFPRAYAAGLTAGSSLIGPIIPPSIFMIIYASMTNTSIGGLFAAGVLPGLVLGLAFMLLNAYYSRVHQVPVSDAKAIRAQAKPILIRSVAALIAPFIIIGGIDTGIVTQPNRELSPWPTAFSRVFSTPDSSHGASRARPSTRRCASPALSFSSWAPPPWWGGFSSGSGSPSSSPPSSSAWDFSNAPGCS